MEHMRFEITGTGSGGNCQVTREHICFTANHACAEAFFELAVTFTQWEEDCYILLPGCAYNGNRFKRVTRSYPPMYLPEETGADCTPLVTDIPALEPDGSGKIQVTSADMAVPCVGIFARRSKQGFLLFTEQQVKGKNLGITVQRGAITVSYPANRSDIYRFCSPHATEGDTGIEVEAGEEILSQYRLFTFPCEDIPAFYERFFALRKSLMHSERAPFLYTRELWELMEQHFNTENWSGEYYAEVNHVWQCGWVGGGMSTYPLLKYGNPCSRERARRTLDYLTGHQAPSGFYYGKIQDGVIRDDSFDTQGLQHLHMVRKSADALYFLFKNFSVTEPKPTWVESARRCADAFVMLFDRYGTFGQFVNVETGELVVGCSTSGMMVPGALASAWKYFGEQRYLDTARKSLEAYSRICAATGITNGGAGDMLSAPDSESAFALLESCMALYEADADPKWLRYAEAAAWYCSSWIVTYAYAFPVDCEFGRLGINTVGSVFANVQNKHAAPGIATLSGDSLLKLYRYTGKEAYLELLKDIAYFIPQCVSTQERPIYSWDTPPQKLAAGVICERVNMSDWEGADKVGGVFNMSCWCETSLLLSFAELMGEHEFLSES